MDLFKFATHLAALDASIGSKMDLYKFATHLDALYASIGS